MTYPRPPISPFPRPSATPFRKPSGSLQDTIDIFLDEHPNSLVRTTGRIGNTRPSELVWVDPKTNETSEPFDGNTLDWSVNLRDRR